MDRTATVPMPARRQCLCGMLAAASTAWTGRALAQDGFEWRPWPKERAVPPLNLPRLEGGRFDLREQRGKVVLLNFWATWCAPCRDEMPTLARMGAARSERGLALVAVNYRETAATVRRFIEALGMTVPVLLDDAGHAARAWTPRIFPTTVLIDRRGRPAGMIVGELDWESPPALQRIGPLLESA